LQIIVVDTTGPIITKPPTFSEDFGIMALTQIYRSSMKVEWMVDDAESYIKRQFLSIKSHVGGEFMLSSQLVSYNVKFFFLNHHGDVDVI
jgi:hypothetical protein